MCSNSHSGTNDCKRINNCETIRQNIELPFKFVTKHLQIYKVTTFYYYVLHTCQLSQIRLHIFLHNTVFPRSDATSQIDAFLEYSPQALTCLLTVPATPNRARWPMPYYFIVWCGVATLYQSRSGLPAPEVYCTSYRDHYSYYLNVMTVRNAGSTG